MKVAIVYIFPNAGEGGYLEQAIRFLQTYTDFPPLLDHDSVIVCNGQPANDETRFIFSGLPNPIFLDHDNSGYDIGGFQLAARTVPCDLMVFFGSTAYLRQRGWLRRVVDAYQKQGDTLYGATGNQGIPHVGVQPHIRTTGFWISPALFNQYPIQVTRPEQRYEYEHGITSLTSWIIKQGKQPWVSVVAGDWILQACDSIPNGFHRGDQSNVLFGDRLTSAPYYHCP